MLTRATFIKRFTGFDTNFDVFVVSSQSLLTLVTTDYADPQDQSRELKDISGQYEFVNLLKPHDNSGETIEILEHDEMEGDFLIHLPYKNYRLDYYVANTRHL